MKVNLIDIRTIEAPKENGALSFFESGKDIPFDVKRIYYTYGVPKGSARGFHAHRELKQILFCPYGEIEIILDDGSVRESVSLDTPSKGLIVESLIWHEMIWKKTDSVLVVGASLLYSETDYIRDYEEFLSAVNC